MQAFVFLVSYPIFIDDRDIKHSLTHNVLFCICCISASPIHDHLHVLCKSAELEVDDKCKHVVSCSNISVHQKVRITA